MVLSGLKTLLETGELLTTPGSLRYVAPRSDATVDSRVQNEIDRLPVAN